MALLRTLAALLAAFACAFAVAQTPPPATWSTLIGGGASVATYVGCGECAGDYRMALADSAGDVVVAGSELAPGPTWRVAKVHGATGAVMWNLAPPFPGFAYGLAIDTAGNVIVTGSDQAGVPTIRTIKFAAADGTVLWDKTWSNPAATTPTYPAAAAVDSAGSVFVAGTAGGDMVTIKYAADGTLLWDETFDGPGSGSDYVRSLAVDTAGNVVVTGYGYAGAASGDDIITVKYSPAGTVVWSKTYHGGFGGDYGNAVSVDSAGNAIVAGQASTAAGFDVVTIKYAAADGAVLWSPAYAIGIDGSAFLVLDPTGNAVVGVLVHDGSAYRHRALLYSAASGTLLREVTHSGPAHADDWAYGVAADAEGNIYLGAGTRPCCDTDMTFLKFGPSSDHMPDWIYFHYGAGAGIDRGVAVIPVASGLILVGDSWEGANDHRIRIVKLPAGAAPPAVRSEFSGDAHSDVFWRDASGGLTYQWQMNGLAISAQGYMPSVPVAWSAAAIGDASGDGRADVLWRNPAGGLNYLWVMSGLSIASQGYLPSVPAPWAIVGMGDADGDGMADVFWRNPSTGQNYLWMMDGLAIMSQGYLASVASSDWEVVGVADYSGDGKADVLWRNKVTGQNVLWAMNGFAVFSQEYLPSVASADWEVAGAPDANADGRADVLWRNKTTGQNYLWLMNGPMVTSQGYLPTVADTNWKVVGYGDYDGDGHGDVLWRHAVSGSNYLWMLNGLAVGAQGYVPGVSGPNWQPVK